MIQLKEPQKKHRSSRSSNSNSIATQKRAKRELEIASMTLTEAKKILDEFAYIQTHPHKITDFKHSVAEVSFALKKVTMANTNPLTTNEKKSLDFLRVRIGSGAMNAKADMNSVDTQSLMHDFDKVTLNQGTTDEDEEMLVLSKRSHKKAYGAEWFYKLIRDILATTLMLILSNDMLVYYGDTKPGTMKILSLAVVNLNVLQMFGVHVLSELEGVSNFAAVASAMMLFASLPSSVTTLPGVRYLVSILSTAWGSASTLICNYIGGCDYLVVVSDSVMSTFKWLQTLIGTKMLTLAAMGVIFAYQAYRFAYTERPLVPQSLRPSTPVLSHGKLQLKSRSKSKSRSQAKSRSRSRSRSNAKSTRRSRTRTRSYLRRRGSSLK
jgi:hypothetical protein